MTTVLLVEDDPAIRQNVSRLMQMEGYAVGTASDGREGLALARAAPPDLLITDINMPGLDGFALLDAVRSDPAFAATAVLMLTALDDRASMRRGMTGGADDYLAKPFTRDELLEALHGLLRKRGRLEHTLRAALRQGEEQLRQEFSASLEGAAPAPPPLAPPAGAVVEHAIEATVLVAQVRQFTAFAEKLPSSDLAELLSRYFEESCLPVLAQGGAHLKLLGDRLVAVFAADAAWPLPAARRAVAAALGLALTAQRFRAWLAERFAGRALPPFAIGVGVHAGAVTLCRLGAGPQQERLPVGAAVEMAARLETASQELGWTVVAATAVLQAAGAGVRTGGVTALQVQGRERWVEVAEVLALQPGPDEDAATRGAGAPAERSAEIAEAVRINSEITTRAAKGALRNKLSTIREHRFEAGAHPPRLKGYRLLRKIGAGGMTEIYLAVREQDALPVVLKVLEASGAEGGEHLARFIQEYALLSRVADPHVIRIYDQGFTDDHAYIAMEYFERGDLGPELRAGMGRQRVLEVLAQVARALRAIHAHGIIHRDLKPENIMVRTDGSVAVADFGVAKALRREDQVPLSQTRHGEVVGTPYYLSPEQAAGDPITPASDLYSLGVMLYEMLTGERPFQAETLHLLLAYHVTAPTPRLPAAHADLQPLLERLMAKRPQDRFADAGELLAQLGAMGVAT